MNYITILDWMLDLDLTAAQLIIYAIIYGFSQDGESCFYGSEKYLAKWAKISVTSVSININKLVDMGLIHKQERAGSTNLYRAINPSNKKKLIIKEEKEEKEVKPEIEPNYESEKNKKDLRTLMKWTNIWIQDPELADLLILWLKNMQANNKYQTLEVYKKKLDSLALDCPTKEEAMQVVEQTIDKGWFSFKYVIDNRKKSFSTSYQKSLHHGNNIINNDTEKRVEELEELKKNYTGRVF